MTTYTPEQIAADVYWTISDFPTEPKGSDLRTLMAAAIKADRAQRPEHREPEFAPEGEPDFYRDAYYGSMTAHGYMYFAIPGEQPIHLGDDEAKHILRYLSEKNR